MNDRRLRALAPVLVAVAVVVAVAVWQRSAEPLPSPAGTGDYLFCFWNVENFFDDQFDKRHGPGDKEYDPWLANNPDVLKRKLEKLTEALLKMNDGKGPDVLALCEVESVRAAELLQQALNEKLGDRAPPYKHVLMKEVTAGRHIAPAILSRLPVVADRTQLLGKRMRILRGVVRVNDHDLIVVASHWTSRIEKGSETRRAAYADAIYGAVKGMYLSDPKVDVLICGDFNDTPDDPSVTGHLQATGDAQAVRNAGDDLKLFNLFAGKDAAGGFGTYYDRGRWSIFDQVVVTPGMLDGQGWNCVPESAKPFNELTNPRDKKGHPWRFGGPNFQGLRGYSDHFPVTVRLKVAAP